MRFLKISENDISDCVKVLRSGGLAVMPTDTIYGIVCRADAEGAVKCLYQLKSRQNNPSPVIASSIDQLVDLGIKRRYLTPVAQYWPNPISIEIPHDLNYLNQNTGRQAFRVVKDPELIKILDRTGPLLTSSANLTGKPHATDIEQAKKYFGGKVDFYLDGGEIKDAVPSTLIRIVDDAVEVLREGAVKINERGEIES